MSIILVIALVVILLLLAWALFGTQEERVETPLKLETPHDDEPERILRRRASDRAIEREFPEEPQAETVRKEPKPEIHEPAGALQLPYSANEIIPDNSRFRLYKRTLINSEVYARRGDFETATSLFRGVHDRIMDSSVREKIESNIDYLNHFMQRREDDLKKKIESRYSEQQPGELRLRIDGPVPQTINIGMPDKGIDSEEIISRISDQISRELNNIKGEVDRLKSKPEEKFDLDDYAEFSNLQHELKTLKEKFTEITGDREKALGELSRLRELKEQQIARDEERDHSDLLTQIKVEMENLNTLKDSLDRLHNRMDDMARVPETKREPSITEARYESSIPIHFDPKPVLEILEKLNQRKSEKPEPEPEPEPEIQHEEGAAEPEAEIQDEIAAEETISEELFTADELKSFGEEAEKETPPETAEIPSGETFGEPAAEEIERVSDDELHADEPHAADELFPEVEIFPEFEPEESSIPAEQEEELPELTDLEAQELIDELHQSADELAEPGTAEKVSPEEHAEKVFIERVIHVHDEPAAEELIPAHDEELTTGDMPAETAEDENLYTGEVHPSAEPAAEEDELPAVPAEEELINEITAESETPADEELLPEPEKELPAELQPQTDEIVPEDLQEEPPLEIPETEKTEGSDAIVPEEYQAAEEPAIPDEIFTKEKEIEKHIDAEEDPNAFDLMSEYGKPKDDSTLSDEDIFEKILQDDRKQVDDSQFEILGDRQRDEQEYTLDDSRLDEKKKSELDFYKKFIKPDRIKKRELPILKVSYDFKKLPDEFSLSREQNILEYSFYKYKPMLQKADEFIKQRRVKDAINYYKVVVDQNIPVEFKVMIRKNIRDLTEYLEKYLSSE